MEKLPSRRHFNRKQEIQKCQYHGEVMHEERTRRGRKFWKCLTCTEEERLRLQEYYRSKGYYKKIWECDKCGQLFTHSQLQRGMCTGCIKKLANEAREAYKTKTKEELEKYGDALRFCRFGVCDHLHMHHDLLKDDPERLTTEFMIKMTCGDEILERYRRKRNEP